MELALFQPDIAGNTGTILRLCACLNTPCHIIEPCGFPFSEKALKRAGMDYLDVAQMTRHADWHAFHDWTTRNKKRLVLMTTKGATPLSQAAFTTRDVILMGSESNGAPDYVHTASAARIFIPMHKAARSLNIAVAAGIALAEGLRQTDDFPNGAAT